MTGALALAVALSVASQIQVHPTGLKSVGLSHRRSGVRTVQILDKLYEQAGKPSLDFDFARYGDLHDNATGETSLVTFSRSSMGTYVGSDGLIKRSAVNSVLYSEQFDNAYWAKNLAVLSANQTIAPDGKQTADALIETQSTGSHFINRLGPLLSASTLYSWSIYVKENGRQKVLLGITNDAGTQSDFEFDLVSLTSTLKTNNIGLSSFSGNITDAGNGWRRLTITFITQPVGFSATQRILLWLNNSKNYTGDGVSGIYIWGAQLEEGPTATPYIRTTSTISGAPRFDHDPVTGESLGLLVEEARTNLLKYSRDLTQADWVDTDVTVALDQTGADGVTSSASSLTATAGNGTVLQAVTSASAARATSAYVKRITGTGTIEMTQDGGSTWTAVTVTSAWTRVTIPSATVTDPEVGFRIVTSGDAIAVDFVQLETGAFSTSAIPTTTVAATRAADIAAVQDADFSTTNLVSYSESFDVSWSLNQATITENTTTAPDGQTTADKMTDVPSGTFAEIKKAFSFTSGVPYAFQMNLKMDTKRYFWIAFGSGQFPANSYAVFDLQDGVVKTQGAGLRGASIRPSGNGFYECTIMATAIASGSRDVFMYIMDDTGTTFSYTGTGTGSIYLWGASLTATEYPVAYTTTRNLLTDSQDFERGTWTEVGSQVNNDIHIAPDGTVTADEMQGTVVSHPYGIYGTNATVISGETYNISTYFKYVNRQWIWIRADRPSTAWQAFDIQNGVVGNKYDPVGVLSDATITDVGNGWYRAAFNITTTSAGGFNIVYTLGSGSTPTNSAVSLVGTEKMAIWGAQLEPGTVATDYVRTVDTVGKAYRWYEPTEGTVLIDVNNALATANISALSIDNYSATTDIIRIQYGVQVFISGPTVWNVTGSSSDFKSALAYQKNNYALQRTGAGATTNNSIDVPVNMARMRIGNNGVGQYLNGRIERISYWPRRQPDATLQVITQ